MLLSYNAYQEFNHNPFIFHLILFDVAQYAVHRLFLRVALLFTVACREKRQLATSVVQMACTVATTTTAATIQKNNKPTATIIYGGTTQQTTKAVGAQFDVKRAGTTHTYTDPHWDTPAHMRHSYTQEEAQYK